MDVTTVQHLPLTTDLSTLIRNAAEEAARRGRAVVASLVHSVKAQAALSMFRRAHSVVSQRFFYARPSEKFVLTGFGSASVITSVGTARFRQAATVRRELLIGACLEGVRGLSGVGPLFFGGFGFDPLNNDQDRSLWAGFPDGRLVMPRVLYTQRDDNAYVTFNLLVEADCDPEAEAAELVGLWQEVAFGSDDAELTPPPTTVEVRDELRPAADWKADVAQAAATIRLHHNELEKVVLARAVQAQADRPFDVTEALGRLIAEYPDTHIFAIEHADHIFLAATPERLVRLHRGQLLTMSLAGSMRRGKTEAEDEALATSLLRSTKDRHEHAIVVQEIAAGLRDLVDGLTIPADPSILRLKNVQHLCTPITGYLIEDYSLLDVVERLHPTPAVGGRPREAALSLIRELEKMDRGWYAAPVGWIDGKGDGEFVVALRSALLHQNEAILFAGCGIMGDSDSEHEYAESNLKLRPMLSAPHPINANGNTDNA
ncbi:MAG: isochorismate synthase [Anaerolineae bacterium]